MRRRRMTRTAIGVLASGVLLSAAATTAVAADAGSRAGDGGDGALVVKKATVVESDYITHVTEQEGESDGMVGGLIKVTTTDGRVLFTYCLDAATDLVDDAAYREAGRSEVPTLKGNPDAAKVDWILGHAYPTVSAEALGKLIGRKLSKGAAAGATQAAIWRFTNHVKAVPWDPAAAELADYLTAHATDAGEPAPSLTLSPGTVTGPAGSVIGPIRIGSTGDQVGVSLDPAAVTAGAALTDREGRVLSDADGKLTRPAKDGDALFVKAPSDPRQGGATVSAASSVPVRLGVKLVSAHSQALGLVSGDRIPVTADAKAGWTAGTSPSPTADPSGPPTGDPSGPPTADPSGSAAPTEPGATTAPGSPGASASTSPHPGGTTGPDPTGGVGSPADTGDSELAATGSGSVLGFVAAAAGGLAAIGGVVVLVHEYRRRFRTRD